MKNDWEILKDELNLLEQKGKVRFLNRLRDYIIDNGLKFPVSDFDLILYCLNNPKLTLKFLDEK